MVKDKNVDTTQTEQGMPSPIWRGTPIIKCNTDTSPKTTVRNRSRIACDLVCSGLTSSRGRDNANNQSIKGESFGGKK